MYEKVRNDMKFGDIISFSGKGDISNIIKWKTQSDISHVGMVYGTEINGEPRIELIESTSLVVEPDIRSKELHKGVQRQMLSQRLESYEGQAYYHRLNTFLTPAQEASMRSWLFCKWKSKTPYDTAQAIGSSIDLFDKMGFENAPDYSSLFCSEMVAKAYEIAGLFEGNPSEQTPADVIKYPFLGDRVQIK